jgi:hypothetical protein
MRPNPEKMNPEPCAMQATFRGNGCPGRTRTYNLLIQNQLRYQLRHQAKMMWCPQAGSNRRHSDFQSDALPAELQEQKRPPAF